MILDCALSCLLYEFLVMDCNCQWPFNRYSNHFWWGAKQTIFFCCAISVLRQEKQYISFVLQQNKYSFLLFVFIHGVTNTLDIMEQLKKDCILYCRFANAVCYILANAPDKMLFYKQTLLTKYKTVWFCNVIFLIFGSNVCLHFHVPTLFNLCLLLLKIFTKWLSYLFCEALYVYKYI